MVPLMISDDERRTSWSHRKHMTPSLSQLTTKVLAVKPALSAVKPASSQRCMRSAMEASKLTEWLAQTRRTPKPFLHANWVSFFAYCCLHSGWVPDGISLHPSVFNLFQFLGLGVGSGPGRASLRVLMESAWVCLLADTAVGGGQDGTVRGLSRPTVGACISDRRKPTKQPSSSNIQCVGCGGAWLDHLVRNV